MGLGGSGSIPKPWVQELQNFKLAFLTQNGAFLKSNNRFKDKNDWPLLCLPSCFASPAGRQNEVARTIKKFHIFFGSIIMISKSHHIFAFSGEIRVVKCLRILLGKYNFISTHPRTNQSTEKFTILFS